MAQEDSRDTRPHGENLGQSFEAHSRDAGTGFEERHVSSEIVVERKKSHTGVWVTLLVVALIGAALVYYFTGPSSKSEGGAGGARR